MSNAPPGPRVMRNQAVLTTPSGRSVRPKKVVESHEFQGTALSNNDIGAEGAGDDSSAAGRPASAPGGESMQDMSEGRTPRTPTKPRVLDYNTIWAGSGSAPASPARPPSASGNLSSVSSEQLLSEQSTTCRNMGAMFEKTGSLNKALDMFNQHLILAQRMGNASLIRKAHGYIGMVYEKMGDHDSAVKYLTDYLQLADEAGDLADQDAATGSLGMTLRSVGSYEEAINLFERKLAISRRRDDTTGQIQAYGNLSVLLRKVGRHDESMIMLAKQLEAADTVEQQLVSNICEIDDLKVEREKATAAPQVEEGSKKEPNKRRTAGMQRSAQPIHRSDKAPVDAARALDQGETPPEFESEIFKNLPLPTSPRIHRKKEALLIAEELSGAPSPLHPSVVENVAVDTCPINKTLTSTELVSQSQLPTICSVDSTALHVLEQLAAFQKQIDDLNEGREKAMASPQVLEWRELEAFPSMDNLQPRQLVASFVQIAPPPEFESEIFKKLPLPTSPQIRKTKEALPITEEFSGSPSPMHPSVVENHAEAEGFHASPATTAIDSVMTQRDEAMHLRAELRWLTAEQDKETAELVAQSLIPTICSEDNITSHVEHHADVVSSAYSVVASAVSWSSGDNTAITANRLQEEEERKLSAVALAASRPTSHVEAGSEGQALSIIQPTTPHKTENASPNKATSSAAVQLADARSAAKVAHASLAVVLASAEVLKVKADSAEHAEEEVMHDRCRCRAERLAHKLEMLCNQKHWTSAISLGEDVCRMAVEIESKHPRLALVLYGRLALAYEQGAPDTRTNSAVDIHSHIMQIARMLGDRALEASACLCKADGCMLLKDNAPAVSALTQCVEVLLHVEGDAQMLADAYYKIVTNYQKLKLYEKALDVSRKLVHLTQHSNDMTAHGSALCKLEKILSTLGCQDEARAVRLKARQVQEDALTWYNEKLSSVNMQDQADAYTKLALVYMELRRDTEAIDMRAKAKSLQLRLGTPTKEPGSRKEILTHPAHMPYQFDPRIVHADDCEDEESASDTHDEAKMSMKKEKDATATGAETASTRNATAEEQEEANQKPFLRPIPPGVANSMPHENNIHLHTCEQYAQEPQVSKAATEEIIKSPLRQPQRTGAPPPSPASPDCTLPPSPAPFVFGSAKGLETRSEDIRPPPPVRARYVASENDADDVQNADRILRADDETFISAHETFISAPEAGLSPEEADRMADRLKGMNDTVEFEDRHGEVQLVPRHVAMQMGGQDMGSCLLRATEAAAQGTQAKAFAPPLPPRNTKEEMQTEPQRSAAPPPSPASGASVYRAAPPSPAEAAMQFELFDELLPIRIPTFPGSAKEEEETISELISELVQLCEEEMWEHAGAMHGRMVGLAATLADYDVPRAVMIYSNLALALSNLADLSTEPARSMSLWNEAIDMQDRVRNIAIRHGDLHAEANACSWLGVALTSARKYDVAVEMFKRCLEIADAMHDNTVQYEIFKNLGNLYYLLGDYPLAIDTLQKQLSLSQVGGDKAGEATSYGNLGAVLASLNRHEDAVCMFEQHLIIAHELGDIMGQSQTYTNLATSLEMLGRHAEALDKLQRARLFAQHLGDCEGQAEISARIGRGLIAGGQLDKAVMFLAESQSLYGSAGMMDEQGQTLQTIGLVSLGLGLYTPAMDSLTQAKDIAERLNKTAALGKICTNLGIVKLRLGLIAEALDLHKISLKIAVELKDLPFQAIASGNIGTCYHKMGRNEEAIFMFKVSVEGSETGVQQTEKAALSRTYSNMGAIYRKMNLHDKAYEMFAKAKSLIGDEKNVVGDQPVSDVMRSKNLYPAAEYRNKRTLEDLEETFSPTSKEPSKPAMQQQAPHYLLSSTRTKRSLDLSKPINAKVTTSPCSGEEKKSIEEEVNERMVCAREIPVALGKVQEVAMTVEEQVSLCQAGGDKTSDSMRMVARAATSRAKKIIENDFRGGGSLQSALLEAQIPSSISDINGTLDDVEAQAKMSVDAKALSLLAQDLDGSTARADGGTWRENPQAPLLLPFLPLTAPPTLPQLEKQAQVLANVANANFDIHTSVLPSSFSLSPSLQCVSDSNALHVGPRGSGAVTISDELLTELSPEPLDENMNPHTDAAPHRRTDFSQPRSPSPLCAAVCSQHQIFSPKLGSDVGSNGSVPVQNKSQVSEAELDQPNSPIRAAFSPVRDHESPQRRAISPMTSPQKSLMCSRSNREQITLFSPRSKKRVISPRSGSAMYAWLHHDISSEVKSPRANSGNKNGPLSSDKHEDLQKRHTGACGAWVAENMIHEISSSAAGEHTATTAMGPASLPPYCTAPTERYTSSTSVNMFSWLHGTLSNSAPASVSATNVLPSVRGARLQVVKISEHAEARKSPLPSPHVNPLKLSTSPEASIPSPTKLSDGAQSARVLDAWLSQSEEDLSKLHSGHEVIQGCFWLPELQSGSVLDTCEWSVCDAGNWNAEQASEPTSEDKALSARPPSESSITLSETPRSLSSTKPRSMSPVLIPEMKNFMNLVCASELATNPNTLTSGGEPDTLVRYLF